MMGQPLTDAPLIRPAEPRDAEAITRIYNQGIAGRQATFETRPREPHELAAWFADRLPFLVAEDPDGDVVGWARVSPYSDRPVYASVGDYGLYVDERARGRGIGTALLEALCNEAEARGMHKLTSRIFAANTASLATARAAGFTEVGVQRRHGKLDGEWRDCVLVERLLGEGATDDA